MATGRESCEAEATPGEPGHAVKHTRENDVEGADVNKVQKLYVHRWTASASTLFTRAGLAAGKGERLFHVRCRGCGGNRLGLGGERIVSIPVGHLLVLDLRQALQQLRVRLQGRRVVSDLLAQQILEEALELLQPMLLEELGVDWQQRLQQQRVRGVRVFPARFPRGRGGGRLESRIVRVDRRQSLLVVHVIFHYILFQQNTIH